MVLKYLEGDLALVFAFLVYILEGACVQIEVNILRGEALNDHPEATFLLLFQDSEDLLGPAL